MCVCVCGHIWLLLQQQLSIYKGKETFGFTSTETIKVFLPNDFAIYTWIHGFSLFCICVLVYAYFLEWLVILNSCAQDICTQWCVPKCRIKINTLIAHPLFIFVLLILDFDVYRLHSILCRTKYCLVLFEPIFLMGIIRGDPICPKR